MGKVVWREKKGVVVMIKSGSPIWVKYFLEACALPYEIEQGKLATWREIGGMSFTLNSKKKLRENINECKTSREININ